MQRTRTRSIAVEAMLVAFISFVIALGVVIGTSFFHADRVVTSADTTHTRYGFPIAWVSQDQSMLTQAPSLPTSITLGSPWEDPTTINLADLFADFAILGAVPALLYSAIVGGTHLARRPSRPRRELQSAAV